MISKLRQQCAERGFDLCHPIHTKWYNDMIQEEGLVESGALMELPQPLGNTALSLPQEANHCFGNDTCCRENNDVGNGLPSEPERQFCDDEYNAVLIGNTKSIWTKFISWLSLRHANAVAVPVPVAEADSNTNTNTRTTENKDDKQDEEILNQLLHDNPFDTFITESLSDIFQSCFHHPPSFSSSAVHVQGLKSYEVFWSHGLRRKVDVQQSRTAMANKNQSPHTTTATSTSANSDYHCFVEEEGQSESSSSTTSSFLVSMQRLAKVTGEYWHDDEGTKLCVHPTYGTWHAFRTLVVFHFDQEAPSSLPLQYPIPSPFRMCPCPVSQDEIQQAKEVMDYALQVMSSGSNNNDGSEQDKDRDTKEESTRTYSYGGVCVISKGKGDTNQELCQYLHNSTSSGSDWSKVSPSMRPWIQLRDCISVGRDGYRYCDNQLLYHYTKDVEILKNELRLYASRS